MTLVSWLPLATICILGAMTPGPSLALVINNTVKGGTRGGLATALGHGVGVGLYALFTAMGLALVISQKPMLFATIQYAGAAFLLYTAYKIITAPAEPNQGEAEHKSRFVGFGGGFMVAFLNPKLALFFLALFSQFVNAEQGYLDQLIMMFTAGGIDALWYGLVALGIGKTGMLSWLEQRARWVDIVSAIVFIGLALLLLIRSF